MGRKLIKKGRKHRKKGAILSFIALTLAAAHLQSYADEFTASPAEAELAAGAWDEEVISVELPMLSSKNNSPFDFILDPQGLINATDAARHSGKTFEEGATLYFKNQDGEYDFSSCSDLLCITNKSTVPVEVTLTAYMEDFGDIEFVADDSDYSEEKAELRIAIMDEGSEAAVLNPDGKAEYIKELSAAEDGESDVFYFGLSGSSNPDGAWHEVSSNPKLTISWMVEPILEEREEELLIPEAEILSKMETCAEETEETREPEKTEISEVTETSEETEMPEVTEAPEETETPEENKTPEKTEIPETTEAPEETETAEENEAPGKTEMPEGSAASPATKSEL